MIVSRQETWKDFEDLQIANGYTLHLRDTDLFKTTRIDIFIADFLQPKCNTCIALICRLLERGTRLLPDLPSLHRHIDQLYGTDFAVEVGRLGERQVIHLLLDLVDDDYLPGKERLLHQGMTLLHDVLRDPVCDGSGFRPEYLNQEKRALKLAIEAQYNDKSLYAQRRCFEALCKDESCGLSVLGELQDFDRITPEGLLQFYWNLSARNPFAIFVSGRLQGRKMVSRWEEFIDWERDYRPLAVAARRKEENPGEPEQVVEFQKVSQGRLVLGYRTNIGFMEPDYPALALFNLLWGGDHNSRLFRFLREAQGLCYHICSHLHALCGFLFVSAGIEESDYDAVVGEIDAQLHMVRDGKLDQDEIETARAVLINRLLLLDDDREGLAWYCYREQITGRGASRKIFCEQLAAVTLKAVSGVASRLHLGKIFFLHRDSRKK